MNLDFLQQQKMLYSFLKKEHFIPSVQRDDFASRVDKILILNLEPNPNIKTVRCVGVLFLTRFKQVDLFSTFLLFRRWFRSNIVQLMCFSLEKMMNSTPLFVCVMF